MWTSVCIFERETVISSFNIQCRCDNVGGDNNFLCHDFSQFMSITDMSCFIFLHFYPEVNEILIDRCRGIAIDLSLKPLRRIWVCHFNWFIINIDTCKIGHINGIA